MKKTNIFRVGIMLTFAAAIIAVVVCLFGGITLDDIFGLVTTNGCIAAATGMVGTVITDGETSAATPTTANLEDADLVDPDFDKDITLFSPDRYPLDTITRTYARKRREAGATRIQYVQKGYKPLSDTLDTNVSGTGKTSADPCSSFTASAGNQSIEVYIKVSTPDIWRKHDTLLMRDLELKADENGNKVISGEKTILYDQMFWVEDKTSNYLKLLPVGGMLGTGANSDKYIVPTFDENTLLVRMGQAKHELDMSTDPYAMLPQMFDQNCQNFMAQVEESTFSMLTKTKKVDQGIKDYQSESIESMRGEMEMSFLWGEKGEFRDGNDQVLFTGGILRVIDRTLYYGQGGDDRTITPTDYTAWLEAVFTGNAGSKDRVLLAGSSLISSFTLAQETNKQIDGSKVEEVFYGVKATKVVNNLGTLHIVHAPLFNESGWQDNGVILDPEQLYRYSFIKLKVQELDLKGSGQKNATARVLQEVACMALRYPECHAIIRRRK